MIKGKYVFIGKPDYIFPYLETGKTYELMIVERNWGFVDWLKGITHPQIISPFGCPYQNWNTFFDNWKLEVNVNG